MRPRPSRPTPRTGQTSMPGATQHGFTRCPPHPRSSAPTSPPPGEGYALPTLRRRVAAIARACRIAGHPLDTKHPAIRETLRGIGRKHGTPPRRSAALTIADMRKLVRACGTTLAGARDRALFLIGFAGALRRSELVGMNVADITWTKDGLVLLITRSKTDAEGAGARIGYQPRQGGRDMPGNCPARMATRGWDHRWPGFPKS